VRDDDIMEMEILRLTGRPRMAIINSKHQDKDYTRDWRQEFRKHFNSIRIFNSNTANFTERISMLESLKAIDQEWEQDLDGVIGAFKKEWEKRNQLACAHITQYIEKCISHTVKESVGKTSDRKALRQKLVQKYKQKLQTLEKDLFKEIRSLFRHHIYEVTLSSASVLEHDLFSKQTWALLGLTKEQLVTAGAVIGGTMGAVADTAAGGITFGVFTAIGGILGAGSALFGGKRIVDQRPKGFSLGGDMLQLGPNENIQLLYILLDRALVYYSQMIKRPHGRRDLTDKSGHVISNGKQGFAHQFSSEQKKTCTAFFKSATGWGILKKRKKAAPEFAIMVESILHDISKR